MLRGYVRGSLNQIPPMPKSLLPVHRALMAAALVVLAGYFVVYAAYAANLLRFPFDYDQGEGFELVDTILFSRGQWPYQDTEVYPFYSSNYPPLFHIIAAPFVWLFGPAYWYGRLLGFLGTLICAAAIGYAVYRDGRHRGVAVLSGLAFLASNTIYHIGPLFRQHMTMVLFETLAVVVLAHASDIPDKQARRRTLLTGMILLLAAAYTKQLAYATAIAAFAFLFIRSPRRALVWGVGFAVVGAAIFVGMNVATDGQWWLQTVTANVNAFYPDQAIGLFRLWFSLHGFLLVPAALYVLYEFYFDRLSIFSLWFVAATANSILAGKWGAGDSYFATAIAALCLLSGLFAARTLTQRWTFPRNYLTRLFIDPLRRIPGLATAGLIVIPLLYLGYGRAVLHLPTTGAVFGPVAQALGIESNARDPEHPFYDSAGHIAGGYADIGYFTTRADIDAGWQIVDRVRSTSAPVLSEEAAFTLLGGKPVLTNPTQLLNLAENGRFRGDALLKMIDDRTFGLIILRAQFYPPDILRAIATGYAQTDSVRMNGFSYILMQPKPTSP